MRNAFFIALLSGLFPFIGYSQSFTASATYDSLIQIWDDPSNSYQDRFDALYFLLSTYNSKIPLDSAAPYADKLQAFVEENGSRKELAQVWEIQGEILDDSRKSDEALELFQKSLDIMEELGDSVAIASLWRNMSYAYYKKRNYIQSKEWVEKSAALYQHLGDTLNETEARRNLAVVLIDMGDYDSAKEILISCISTFKEIGAKSYQAKALSGLAILTANQGDLSTAGEYFGQSLEIKKELKDTLAIAQVLGNLGVLYSYTGEYEKAIAHYEESIAIEEARGYKTGMAKSLANVGVIYVEQGDYPKGMAYYQRSLKLYEEISDSLGTAYVLSNLGIAYGELKEYEQAADYHRKSIIVKQKIGDPRGLANGYNNLGGILRFQGKFEEAIETHHKALEIRRKLKSQNAIANSLFSLGTVYKELEVYDQAISYFKEAIEIQKDSKDQLGYASSLNALGDCYHELSNSRRGLPYLEKAYQLGKKTGNIAKMNSITFNLYEVHKALNNNRQAMEMFEEYITFRDSLASEDNQRAAIRFEFEQKALLDSISYVQTQAEAEVAYQKQLTERNQQIARRNLWLIVAIAIAILGFIGLRYRNQLRSRKKELELQRERERKIQLETLDNLKTRFFTNISHEFRTPLTVILGMANQLPDQYDQSRKLIRRNGHRLLRLINQLLDLSRMESHSIQLNQVQGDIVSYLTYISESFQSLAEERQISLQVQTEVPTLIMDYDAEKVQDIVYNLLSNALKFTPEEGKVILYIKSEVQSDQPYLLCTVEDSGPGILPDEMPKIFDRFYQGAAISREGSTGIGLSLAKALIEKMGGSISVKSEVGKGTAFTFSLPVTKGSNTPLAHAKMLESEVPTFLRQDSPPLLETADHIDRPQVLIIEDNPDVVTYLGAVLGSSYSLLTAMDGQAGIELARERIPDLIISDVMMPIKDGFEVTETLKADPITSHIPIILLTAKATQADKISGLKYGADAYLSKPFDHTELQVRMDNLLELRKKLQAYYREALPIPDSSSEIVKPPSLEDIFLEKIRSLVEEKLADPTLSVHQMCEVANLGPTQVYRKLKALTGLSPTLFIRRIRLKKAMGLLKGTHLNVSEIAYDVGFNDPSYFTRVFTKEYGKPPIEVKEKS